MRTVHVKLPHQNGYPIHISGNEKDWGRPLASLQCRQVIVVTSPRVARYCLPELKRQLARHDIRHQTVFIPDGEKNKNASTLAKAWSGLIQSGIDRSTPILLLGGGVVGDLGGFAAATILRGVPFVQIGTTLVAQVDSSIGGKLGIDLPEGKNLAGVFGQPRAVLSHVPFLRTLPRREIVGGMAEVLKYGVIRDADLFEAVFKNRQRILNGDPSALAPIVQRSSEIKAEVVSKDEKESSLRMILNFGHTFGHAIERLTHYRKYLHGEAVGIGMTIAARLSHQRGLCSAQESTRVQVAVANLGLPTKPPQFSRAQWISALEVDKKSRGGMIRFVFMKKIGDVVVRPIRPSDLVKEFMQ